MAWPFGKKNQPPPPLVLETDEDQRKREDREHARSVRLDRAERRISEFKDFADVLAESSPSYKKGP